MSIEIRCLTVKQPWAALFFEHGNLLPKDVENRKQSLDHIGPLIIHSGKTLDADANPIAASSSELCLGSLLGVVFMYDCRGFADATSPWHEPQMAGYYVSDPCKFDVPVPWRGRLGLWSIDFDELPEATRKQICVWGKWF